MSKLSTLNKIQELFNSNKVLLNSIIGHFKHDSEVKTNIATIISTIEIIVEQEYKIESLLENLQ